MIICGCVFLLLVIIGIIVFLNKPKPNANPINTFVAVGEGSDTISWSDDGKNWNKIAADSGFNSPGVGRGTCVASNGNVWVAGGQESVANAKNMVFSKDNARTWAPVNLPSGTYANAIVNGLVWNGTNFIAVGAGFIGGTTAVWSEDGQNWNSSTGDLVLSKNTGVCVRGRVLACKGKICVCFGATNVEDLPFAIIYSDDSGKSWVGLNGQGFSSNSVVSFLAVNDKNYWVAISKKSTTTNILCSYKGKDWTSPIPSKNIFNDPNCELYCVAHDNESNWVVVGNKGIGYSRDNGETWKLATGGDFTKDSFYSVVYNGKIWVASGSKFILYSSEGINWTKSDTINSHSENHLCWNSTVWVSGGLQSPAIRWSDDITKPWNSTPDTFFKKIDSVHLGVVHDIACRYKV